MENQSTGNIARSHSYSGISATGNARQHNGDFVNHGNYYEVVVDNASLMALASQVTEAITKQQTDVLVAHNAALKHLPDLLCAALDHRHRQIHLSESDRFPGLDNGDRKSTGNSRRRRIATSHRRPKHVKILLPAWLIGPTWSASVAISIKGWKATLQTWRIVPDDSPIFKLVKAGDFQRVQKMIVMGTASPYDHTQFGSSLVEAASLAVNRIGNEDFTLLRYLLELSGSADVTTLFLHLSLSFTSTSARKGLRTAKFEILMYKLLMEEFWTDTSELLAGIEYTRWPRPVDATLWWTGCRFKECLRFIYESLPANYRDVSLDTRIVNAWSLVQAQRFVTADLFLMAAGESSFNDALVDWEDEKGWSLLHRMAQHYGSLKPGSATNVKAIDLCSAFVQGGARLHAINEDGHTPSMVYLLGLHRHDLIRDLSSWANLLLKAGVDLGSYGENELEIWRRMSPMKTNGHRAAFSVRGCSIKSFTFGPQPHHWTVLARVVVAKIPVYEEELMPGTWLNEMQRLYLPTTACWAMNHEKDRTSGWALRREVVLLSRLKYHRCPKPWYDSDARPKQTLDDTVFFKLKSLASIHGGAMLRRSASHDAIARHKHQGDRRSPKEYYWVRYLKKFGQCFHLCSLGLHDRIVLQHACNKTCARHALKDHFLLNDSYLGQWQRKRSRQRQRDRAEQDLLRLQGQVDHDFELWARRKR